jgi:hypothetical protein
MIIRFGKVVHHNDCTYCQFRADTPVGKKGKRIFIEERCRLTNWRIPAPFSTDGIRYCPEYKQVGCECEACKPKPETLETK